MFAGSNCTRLIEQPNRNRLGMVFLDANVNNNEAVEVTCSCVLARTKSS
jgi:hypothetical protein